MSDDLAARRVARDRDGLVSAVYDALPLLIPLGHNFDFDYQAATWTCPCGFVSDPGTDADCRPGLNQWLTHAADALREVVA